MLLLSATLGVLSLGIFALGLDLLAGPRRKAALATVPQDDLRVFLRTAPPMRPLSPEAGAYQAPGPEEFVFRRHVSRDFASMEPSHKRFRPAPEAESPPAATPDFSTIRREVRAALDAVAPARPRLRAPAAQLIWTEPGRLAVLTLARAKPESGLALLREHGIATLIAAPGHPFHLGTEGVEILSLPDGADAAAPLAARLRARLSKGERIAFHTEAGLSGAAALLAARFSSRQAG